MKILLRDNYKIQPDALCCKGLDENTAKILVKFLANYAFKIEIDLIFLSV